MVLKIGIKRTRDLGMLRPSRADLAAEAVVASLNCTRAWRHKTLFRRYHLDLSKKKLGKQILPGMAGDMATYIYKGIVCGGQQRVRCCSGVGTQDRVEYNQ
jgi:hypothetical protein